METDSVTIEVTFKAPVKNVWKAWTDPALILTWFGSDPNGKGLRANLDVQPGGAFEVTFSDADHTEHSCYGIYAEVLDFRKLAFSWSWKSEPGVESFVSLLLTPAGDSTQMHFEHARLGNASKHDYAIGWQSTFSKLERMLTKQA